MAISNSGNMNSAATKILVEAEDENRKEKKKGNSSRFVWLNTSVHRIPGKKGIIKQWDKEFRKAMNDVVQAKKVRTKAKTEAN